MYLNQYWKDERLAFSSEDEVLTLSGDFAEKIWVPDTFFANDKSRLVRSHGFMFLFFPSVQPVQLFHNPIYITNFACGMKYMIKNMSAVFSSCT